MDWYDGENVKPGGWPSVCSGGGGLLSKVVVCTSKVEVEPKCNPNARRAFGKEDGASVTGSGCITGNKEGVTKGNEGCGIEGDE